MILDNGIIIDLENDSAEEIARHVINGDVTIKQLENTPDSHLYAQSKRSQVLSLVEAHYQKDQEEYEKAEAEGTIEAYQAYLEQFPEGKYCYEALQIIEEMEEKQRQDERWDAIDKEDPTALKKYIADEPNSPYIDQAKELRRQLLVPKPTQQDNIEWIKDVIYSMGYIDENNVNELQTQCKARGTSLKELIIDCLKQGQNNLSADVIYNLYKLCIIDREDLLEAGIAPKFIDYVTRVSDTGRPEFAKNIDSRVEPELPTKIFLSTEIYFWGTPNSGKTTALGAILSAASTSKGISMENLTEDPGSLAYSLKLTTAFKGNKIKPLLHNTAITSFFTMYYELSHTPIGAKESQTHPLTLIDMSGELMCAILRDKLGEAQMDDTEMITKLNKILAPNSTMDRRKEKNANRRIHIFLLEYGAHESKFNDYLGTYYLEGTLGYLKKKNLLAYSTDAVYIMLTKVDKAFEEFEKQDEQERDFNSFLNNYLNTHYTGICNLLQEQCKMHSLNGGNLQFFPFSIGTVCLETLCDFDPTYANGIVQEILLNKTATRDKKSLLSR